MTATRVLFVSASNASHSILAEALLRRAERVGQFVLLANPTRSAVAS